MSTIDFDRTPCSRIERYLDYYISNELSVESTDTVLRHLEGCPRCSGSLEERLRLRSMLRRAVKAQEPSWGAEDRVRRALRAGHPVTERRRNWWTSLPVAAALAAGLALAAFQFNTWSVRDRVTAVAVNPAQDRILLTVGMEHHLHCKKRVFPQEHAPLDALRTELGPEYAELLPVVTQQLREYRLVEAHQCRSAGRTYAHFVLRDNKNQPMSFLLVSKQAGESFSFGQALRQAMVQGHAVTGFETSQHLAFLCSELPLPQNAELTGRLREGMSQVRL